MPPSAYPSVHESRARLHRAGWSIGEIAGVRLWLVSGNKGENRIHAEGESQAKAWYRATRQAEAVGKRLLMLVQWAWNYFTRNAACLISGEDPQAKEA